ncbi:polysaccharide deacetylase family protein, partial [uncultured Tyzzerella sp.]|uniref:polysaccharide deacetylase family protein n=1 Tax=uncultured Tyzzerella sp. TaxID=2321398 RepID=UPI0029420A40
NYSTYPNPVKFYETYIIDITSGEFLSIEDIFINGYEDLFYDYAKNYFFNNYGLNITKKSENYNYIKPNKEVYKKIFLKDENVEVFFYDYKKQEEIFIKIPFENVLPYIKKEYIEQTTTTTLASTTTTNKEITTQATTVNISENSTQTTVTKETTTEQITTEQTTTDKVTTEQIIKENNNRKRKIDKNKPMIALTFDDGPNGNTTNKILDVLEENNSVATFFLVSRRIEKDKETLKRMDMLGNQIGNHTANHKDLTKLSKDKIKTEVDIVNKALKNTIGKEATIVRVPYGAVNDTVKQTVEYPIIMWNIDTKDWKNKNANTIQKEVLGKVKDGDIVLMHDLYDSTAKACEVIIPKLVEQGYQLVTVEELFEYKGIEMKKGNKYSNANKK